MGLLDALTGKIYRLNTVLKPEAKMLLDLSQCFPQGDFLRDYFSHLWYAVLDYIETPFEINDNQHPIKKYIKQITPTGAKALVKLVSFHHTQTFTSNKSNVVFLMQLNITPDLVIHYLAEGLSFTPSDFDLFKNLSDKFTRDHASYSIEWGKAFYRQVFGKAGTVPINELYILRGWLHENYKLFVSTLVGMK